MAFRLLAYGASVSALVAGAAALALWEIPPRERQPQPVREVVRQKATPSLYCVFSDFTHASAVVGFDFEVTFPKGAAPRFLERAEAVRNDPAVTYDTNSRPNWAFALDEDGTQTIASPDGATRILLYGLKLGATDPAWTEAGIRSNTFRNLDGKCFQSHFDTGRDDLPPSAHP